jgi:hypothetical protein
VGSDVTRSETQQLVERMGVAKLVVPVCQQQDNRHPVDPTDEEPQDVQSRLLRPVQVLDGEHGRAPG